MSKEPLLTPDDKRFVMFPIKYDDIWAMYKKQVDCFWRPEEIDLSKDLDDWAKLNDDEKHFISMMSRYRRPEHSMGSRLRWKISTATHIVC